MAYKLCCKCGENKTFAHFIACNSPVFGEQMPICRNCISDLIEKAGPENRWNVVDKICQFADIPFIPEEFEKIYQAHNKQAFGIYAAAFKVKQYESLDWGGYNKAYLELKDMNAVDSIFPELQSEELRKLQLKWGVDYDREQLFYLENLYTGILSTIDVVSALNDDQIIKLCKVSLIIEEKMRAGLDFDKDLKSYENLCKLAGITNEVIKNGEEFNSSGELFSFLENLGFKPKYWRGDVRDEVDKSMKDIMFFNRYVYINEAGTAQEIQERIDALKQADELNKVDFDWQEFAQYSDDFDDNETFDIEI